MSLMNTFKFINLVYSYLGYKHIIRNDEIDLKINDCLKEIENLQQFKYIYTEFDYKLDFLNNNEAYKKLLDKTESYYLCLTTLGKRIDDRCQYYSKFDLEKMVIFDATSNAYLEYMADEFEEANLKKPRTYRFCPGYQGTDIKDIKEIFKYIDHKKIGVEILDSNLMVPLKTMCGIIGIGKTNKKECGACNFKGNCKYIKEKRKCYSTT